MAFHSPFSLVRVPGENGGGTFESQVRLISPAVQRRECTPILHTGSIIHSVSLCLPHSCLLTVEVVFHSARCERKRFTLCAQVVHNTTDTLHTHFTLCAQVDNYLSHPPTSPFHIIVYGKERKRRRGDRPSQRRGEKREGRVRTSRRQNEAIRKREVKDANGELARLGTCWQRTGRDTTR